MSQRDQQGRYSSTGFGVSANPASFSSPATSKTVSLNDFKGNKPRPAPSMGSNPRPLGMIDDGTTSQVISNARAASPSGLGGRLAGVLRDYLDVAEGNSVGSSWHGIGFPGNSKYNGAGQVAPATRVRSNAPGNDLDGGLDG